MDSRTVIPWSDLPKELVEKIGNCLDTHIDVLRFRAVCSTWHSARPPFKSFPSLPDLFESTVYLFQPLDDAASVASSCDKAWLVKVTQTLDGKLHVTSPVTDHFISEFSPLFKASMPKVLNLLDLRVSQVCKSYHLKSSPWYNDYVHPHDHHPFDKILVSTNHACNETNQFCLMAITRSGGLHYLKSGSKEWTNLKDGCCNIMDIILFKRKFYAVDQYGKTVVFDSSLNETKASSRLQNGRTSGNWKKRLVESLEQLYLVDMILDTRSEIIIRQKSLEIKIYRLDEERHQWIAVCTLGDRIFFAGDDCCFSVSSQVFGNHPGNCIYFAKGGLLWEEYTFLTHLLNSTQYFSKMVDEQDSDGLSKEQQVHIYKPLHDYMGVFTIEDGYLRSLLSLIEYAQIFWPPPSWLNQARSDALVLSG